ncbi:MFS general substrate transporter [Sistotremastrum niveocremeum HHB9708]|uniref:MFS general substrate transporter n=1 Tax=Sistotremastrum niveocremeum HHB9708 TaxID=1314777 RepID=A0A164T6B3_9AGAM|nr:MFS general substrate transporter [Sistotremastrum niveocremeum HHB9708]
MTESFPSQTEPHRDVPAPSIKEPLPSTVDLENSATDVTVTRSTTLSLSKEFDQSDLEKKPQAQLAPTIQPREGGRKAWMTVFGAFLIQAVTIGHITAFGVYEEFYKQDRLRTTSPSAISWIGSTQLALLFGLGLVTGPLMDKGRFKKLVYTSTLLYAIGEFTLSLTQENKFNQIFLSQGLCMGLAMGLTYSPSLVINGYYFQTRKRALAMGIATCGSAVGGVVQPIMLNNLLANGTSFANTVRVNAAMNTGLLLIACIMMSDLRTQESFATKKTPVNLGAFFRDMNYVLLVVGGFAVGFGLFFPSIYIQLFCITKGFPQTFSFYSLSILNGTSLVGRIIPSIISDRYTGPVPMIVAMAFGLSFTLFGFLGIADRDVGGLTAVTVIFGFFYGGFTSLLGPTFASTAKNGGEIGARIGMAVAVGGAIPSLVSAPINGALLTNNYHWNRPILLSGAVTVIGSILMLLERFVHQSWLKKGSSAPLTCSKSIPDERENASAMTLSASKMDTC